MRWQNAGNLVLLLLMLSDENGGENEMKKKGILVRSEKEEKKKQAPQNEAVWRLLIRLFESRKREILSWPSTTHTGEEDHYCHGLFFFFNLIFITILLWCHSNIILCNKIPFFFLVQFCLASWRIFPTSVVKLGIETWDSRDWEMLHPSFLSTSKWTTLAFPHV